MAASAGIPEQDSPLPFYLWLRGVACNKLLEIHRHHLGVKMRDARRECANHGPSMADTTSACAQFVC